MSTELDMTLPFGGADKHMHREDAQRPVERLVMRDGAQTLEEMLLALAKYGKPRISHDGNGWYCAVEMYVSASGVDFKVASEFSRPSPMAAAQQCASRLDKALSDIGA